MKLHFSPTSPYVRKVTVLAIETGLDAGLERLPTNIQAPDDAFLAANPLGKVPALLLPAGAVLYDSRVICEYLDSLHDGPPLFPAQAPARWQALGRQALADGVLDAAVLCRLESLRAAGEHSPAWVAKQWGKVQRGLDALEGEAPAFNDEPLAIGHIAAACALGWLDFRFAEQPWRPQRPALAQWYAAFADRPSMRATVPHEP